MRNFYPLKSPKALITVALIVISAFLNQVYSQEINITGPNQTVNNGATFVDSGGSTGDYGFNENNSITLTAATGGTLIVNFTNFSVESTGGGGCFDFLQIFNGNAPIAANRIGFYCDGFAPGTITSTGSQLHFVFDSDNVINQAGWIADIYVSPADPAIPNPDGDAFNNLTDADDDNDGILDTLEFGTCSGTDTNLDWSSFYTAGTAANTGEDPLQNPTIDINGVGLTLQREVIGVINNQQYRIQNLTGTFVGDGYVLTQSSTASAESRHTFIFDEPVFNLGFTLFDVDTGPNFTDNIDLIFTLSDGSIHTLNAAEYTTNGQTVSGNTITGTGLDGSFVVNGIQQWVVQLELRYRNSGGSPSANQAMAIGDFSFCQTQDTDNDGIKDYLDLDSDGDGCFDALEGGAGITTVQVDGSGRITGGVDGSGVPNLVSGGQSVGTATDFDTRDAQCDDDGDGVPNASDVCNGFDDNQDADSDGIPDNCDTDNDNDGITDANEGLNCAPGALNVGTTGSFLGAAAINDIYPHDGVNIDLAATTTNANLTQLQVQNATTLRVQGNNADDGAGDSVVYTFTFSQPVTNVNFRWTGIDQGDKVTVTSTGPSGANDVFMAGFADPVFNTISDDYNGSGAGDPNPNGVLFDIDNNGTNSPTITSFISGGNANNSFTDISINGVVSSFQVTTRKERQDGNVANNGSVTFTFTNFEYCTFDDVDNDNIPNHLDSDSDGDGCFDVVESGGVDTTPANGILDGTGFSSTGQVTGGSGGYNGLSAGGGEFIAVEASVDATALVDQTVAEGASTSFTITSATASSATSYSSGTPTYGTPGNANAGINYQWFIGNPSSGGTAIAASDPNYSGENTDILNIANVTGLNNTEYFLVVSHNNNLCLDIVNSATLFVGADSDNDSVSDITDLDDDNDGILDTVELASCSGSISYEYYDGTPAGLTVDNIPTTSPDASGTFNSFDVDAIIASIGADNNSYGLRFRGYLNITTAGTYNFYLASDDGSKLFIDGVEVIDNDGDHAVVTVSNSYFLGVGLHEIVVPFYENGGGESLDLDYELPGTISRQDLPFSDLFCYLDTDGDGTPNHLDLDSDGDGCPDARESGGVDESPADGRLDGTGFSGTGLVTGGSGGYNGATGNEIIATQITALATIANQTIPSGGSLNVDATSTATNTIVFTGGTPDYGSGTDSSTQLLYEFQIDRGDGAGFVTIQANSSSPTYSQGSVTNLDAGTYRVNVTHSQNICLNQTISFTVNVLPIISIGDVTVDEGAGTASVPVSIDVPSSVDTVVEITTATGTAGTSDYTTTTTTVTIPAGSTSVNVSVPITDDTTDEPNETFTVNGNVTSGNTSNTDPSGTVTITDNDGTPVVTIGDVTVDEGAGTASVPVSIDVPSSVDTVVEITTATGTAGTSDYTTTTTTVTIPAGSTSVTVSIPVTDDGIDEPSETFTVNGNVTSGNTSNTDPSGTVTITDNDGTPVVSIGSPTVDEGAGTASVPVSIDVPSSVDTVVEITTATGTAGASDYTTTTTTVTIPAGSTSVNVSIPVTDDGIDEPNETFTVNGNVTSGNTSNTDPSGTVTITDNDGTPVVTIGDVTVDEGAGTASVPVSIDVPSSVDTVVEITTATGTAGTSDYTTTTTTVTIPAGSTSVNVSIPVTDDTTDEPNETFTVNGNVTSGNTSNTDPSGTVTITDNDGTPVVTIGDVTVDEGAGTASVPVSIDVPSSVDTVVEITTATGTAGTSDYTTTTTTVIIPAGSTSVNVSIPVTDDGIDEPNETFTVNGNVTSGNTSNTDPSGTVTITDNDGTPVVSIGDVTVDEGAGTASVPVSIDVPSSVDTVVEITTATGTAGTSDYTTTTTTVTIPAGNTSVNVNIPITDDTTDEPNETFTVNGNVTSGNTSNTDPSGTVTITDNDGTPVVSIGDVTVDEGAGTASVPVSIDVPSSVDTVVEITTATGTAGTSDYTTTTTTVTIPAGSTSVNVSIPVTDDTTDEPNETFTVNGNVTSGNTSNTDPSGTVTITDNDGTPVVTIGDVTVDEGAGTASVPVSIDVPSSVDTVVEITTATGTAGTSDYTTTTTTVTIPAGSTSVTVSIPVTDDGIDEPSETFTVNGNVTSGNTSNTDPSGTVTITDNDGTPVVSIGSQQLMKAQEQQVYQ
ncbi:Calx-beta domain-containing protein [Tenacibaculum jejuense]|uniref:Calx-beta domain-containing protein n=1 Tax=Tenacibaculum jejuense TaxID=584609 RepID=UPI0012FD0919|nr:Calx-beta domain-containing protein [Tenacibaculum jejuense]